ncbi:MAG: carboxymuconolactone decarboxylase family protein [Gemmatimonadaceae bacterium]
MTRHLAGPSDLHPPAFPSSADAPSDPVRPARGRARGDVERSSDPAADLLVSPRVGDGPIFDAFDGETAMLVAVAAVVAGGSEPAQRDMLRRALPEVRAEWIEEVILQSYLFAGFPRALNAMRIWRAVSGRPAPSADVDADDNTHDDWTLRGEATCAAVYGHFYDRLRVNIAALHPALDSWMVTDGYGMVLGRPALDLARRELCVVAACVAAQQDRQLHSHLHGALHVGAAPAVVAAAVDQAIAAMGTALDDGAPHRYRQLWLKVLVRHHARLAEMHVSAARAADTPAHGSSSNVSSAS